nr:FACT complex subunit like [Ipomoea batatas]
MMLRSSKPPLPRSPIRLRSRRALRSTTNTLQTPPGSLTKSKLHNPRSDVEEWEMRLEYHSISCELRALAKMVQQEIGNGDGGNPIHGNGEYSLNPRSPLFERGRLYEEYSARRNERLKRKKCGETEEEKKAVYGLGVRVESAKKRGVPVTPMMAQRGGGEKSRYMLRSMTTSKENKKPPPHLPMSVEKSVVGGEKKKKIAVRRSRKI